MTNTQISDIREAILFSRLHYIHYIYIYIYIYIHQISAKYVTRKQEKAFEKMELPCLFTLKDKNVYQVELNVRNKRRMQRHICLVRLYQLHKVTLTEILKISSVLRRQPIQRIQYPHISTNLLHLTRGVYRTLLNIYYGTFLLDLINVIYQ